MKINLIGMILNNSVRGCFDGAIIDDDGNDLDAEHSLDIMIMEYSKVRNGGESSIVAVSRSETIETKEYADGTIAIGVSPLPDKSPDQQETEKALRLLDEIEIVMGGKNGSSIQLRSVILGLFARLSRGKPHALVIAHKNAGHSRDSLMDN